MFDLKLYNFVRVLSLLCFVSIAWKHWDVSILGLTYMLLPYILIFVLATKKTYCSRIRISCRTVGAVAVSLVSIGLVIEVGSDPQASIGMMYAVAMQYGVLFISEAIIGLVTYPESNP
ncbi:hypothetical protein ACSLBF_18135 (plasmid) [Pseudoalteromonas sp. T1lg65]|uniref:hypothetical protein n=1 Tax=Pseudoalteromonas sp. T1lg65 TaxID=2077101 RepID=UPI003F79BDE0